jgi:hypothetical protein
MRKIRTILLLTLTFFLLTMSAAAQKAPARDYFPLRVGDSWTYRTTPEPSEFTIKVLSEEKQADGTIVYLLERKAGSLVHTWYSKANGWVNILKEAYPEHEGLQMEHEKPKQILKIPFVTGAQWTWSGKSTTQMEMTERYKVIGIERVVVPAGTFQAVKVETKIAEGSGMLVRNFWYAEGVGVVKSWSEAGAIDYGYELIDYSFKKATPAKKPASPRRRTR